MLLIPLARVRICVEVILKIVGINNYKNLIFNILNYDLFFSCSPSCKSKGDCCSDYDSVGCDLINMNTNLTTSTVESNTCTDNVGCVSCDSKLTIQNSFKQQIPLCNLCSNSLYYFNGTCIETCPENTISINTNKICIEKLSCSIKNCDACENSVCKTCKRGTFMYNGQCLYECPNQFRADRITWACLEPPVFAWYWVYPSRSSCKTNCGIVVAEDADCSCNSDCFQFGNCCQDIEDFCPDLIYWRKKGKSTQKSKKNKKEISDINKSNSIKNTKPLLFSFSNIIY